MEDARNSGAPVGRYATKREPPACSRSRPTFWEIALLARRGRIVARLPLERWRRDLIGTGLSEIGLDGRIGIRAAELEGLHRDPADRMIVATALQTGARLLTADRHILDWPGDLDCQDART